MRLSLKKMRAARSEEQLKSSWSAFKGQFPRAQKFIKFIEKNWMTPERISKWATYIREARPV
jgi:hypothetical protein